jgi:tetratricopeptide (TPR) repeat protein
MPNPKKQNNWQQTWASHWLLICGSFLIVISVVLVWLKFPYSFNVGGWELPIQNVVPHIHEFSYGFTGIAVLALAFFLRNRWRWSLLLGAAILITLWLLVPGRIIFHQAPLLRRLSEETQAVPAIEAFNRGFSRTDHDRTEETARRLEVVTLPGRLTATLSILGTGWFCFGLGAFLVAGYVVSRQPEQRTRSSLAIIAVPIAVLSVLGMPSFIGQYHYHRAALARNAGRNEEAIANYRKAMSWDRFYTGGVEVYTLIGEVESEAGLAQGSAERSVCHAMDLRAQDEFENAISELEQAARKNPALATPARHEASRIRAELALARYDAGALAEAVTLWEKALSEDTKGRPIKSQPSMSYVLPYLARANYELGRYEAGLDAATRWAEITEDHGSLRAVAYQIASDCSSKLGREAEARHYSTLATTSLAHN